MKQQCPGSKGSHQLPLLTGAELPDFVKRLFFSTQNPLDCIWNTASNTRQASINWSTFRIRSPWWSGTGALALWKEGDEAGLPSARRKGGFRGTKQRSSCVYREGVKKREPVSFRWWMVVGQEAMEKLKTKAIQTGYEDKFPGDQSGRLPRETGQSLSIPKGVKDMME